MSSKESAKFWHEKCQVLESEAVVKDSLISDLENKVAELEKELDQTEALGRSILNFLSHFSSDIVCEDYATAKKRAKLFYKDARK